MDGANLASLELEYLAHNGFRCALINSVESDTPVVKEFVAIVCAQVNSHLYSFRISLYEYIAKLCMTPLNSVMQCVGCLCSVNLKMLHSRALSHNF